MQFLKQFLTFFILVSIISLAVYIYVDTGAIGIDDGNIFLNYAHHIANGDGFVFNTNGERVEGFTSFLWVIICAAFYLITNNPEILIICFCCLLTALTITIVYREIKKDIEQLNPFFSKYFFWIYCAFIICTGPSYFAWSVLSIMENALWNLLFTMLVLLIAKTIEPNTTPSNKKFLIIILGCLLALARPEALAWNLVFTIVLLWTFIQNKRKIFFPIIYFAFVAATSAGLTLFRLHYFGFRFPNTYYAKISPDKIYNITEGAKYAISFLAGYQPVITFLFVLMALIFLYSAFQLKILNKRKFEVIADNILITKLSIIALIILIGFALPCTTGGDHFGGFRFYQGLLLLLAFGITAIVWLFKYYQTKQEDVKFLSLSAIILFLLIIGLNDMLDLKNPSKTQMNFEFELANEGRAMAEELNNIFTENKPSVGIIAVGGFGLKYQGNTVDLMGLNNILMGHSPGDRKGIKNHAAFNKDVFYKLNPDVVLPYDIQDYKHAVIKYTDLLNENNFDNQAMKNIFNDDNFQKTYSPVFITGKKNAGLFAFVNNNSISLLMKNPNLAVQKIQ